MKVLIDGHVYELRELGSNDAQKLTFVRRSGGAVTYDKEWAGLRSQEVLRVLIDRTKYLHDVLPCKETEEALYHLRRALFMYEARAYRRKQDTVNRTTSDHDERVDFSDIPFTEEAIELRPIGDDGHILL